MASYSLLNAISGFEFDATQGMIGFSPVNQSASFTSFWSLDAAWGTVHFSGRSIVLKILYGRLTIDEFRSKRLVQAPVKSVRVGARMCAYTQADNAIRLKSSAVIAAGETLEINLK